MLGGFHTQLVLIRAQLHLDKVFACAYLNQAEIARLDTHLNSLDWALENQAGNFCRV